MFLETLPSSRNVHKAIRCYLMFHENVLEDQIISSFLHKVFDFCEIKKGIMFVLKAEFTAVTPIMRICTQNGNKDPCGRNLREAFLS